MPETTQRVIQELRQQPSDEDRARPQTVGGLIGDFDVVEPDEDPLSCLKEEEGEAGGGRGGRPSMRRLVAPVDPNLAVSSQASAICCLLLLLRLILLFLLLLLLFIYIFLLLLLLLLLLSSSLLY